jgi:hypothetical protein
VTATSNNKEPLKEDFIVAVPREKWKKLLSLSKQAKYIFLEPFPCCTQIEEKNENF